MHYLTSNFNLMETHSLWNKLKKNLIVIDKNYILEGSYELEVATKKIKCNVHLDSLYDPQMLKIKA